MIYRRLYQIFWNSDLTASRLFLALASLMWSFLLFWPGETFARPTYFLMNKLAPELIWASLFGIQGVLALYSIIYKSRNKILLIGDATLGCILWTGSCIAMLLSVYPPPAAISAEILSAYLSWWVLARYPVEFNKEASSVNRSNKYKLI